MVVHTDTNCNEQDFNKFAITALTFYRERSGIFISGITPLTVYDKLTAETTTK